MKDERPLIRKMVAADLDPIMEIEKETFPEPFSRSLFEHFLAHEAFNNIVMVYKGRVVGYAMYSFVADESDLVNIAVAKEWRRKGLGYHLMSYILDHLRSMGGKRIFLDVRPSNKAAREFYGRFGFVKIGIRRNYYQDSGEDALVYSRDLRW